jgi:hypothetical protein
MDELGQEEGILFLVDELSPLILSSLREIFLAEEILLVVSPF